MNLSPTLRAVLVAFATFALLAAGGIAGFFYLEFRAPFRGDTFDAARWAAAQPREPGAGCGRCAMVHDLTERHLPGERAAVAALLGPPDKKAQKAHGETDCDAFLLGLDLRAGAWWNEAWLYVCYGEGGRVMAAFPLVY